MPETNVPSIDDPSLRFMDWEDRPLAIIDKQMVVFRVFADGTLERAPASWTFSEVFVNSSPISKAEALKLASR